jgi:hypothetical protein
MDQEGYLYCFENECMPGILKIGFTERTIEERLQEANSTGTFGPPKDYKIVLGKYVKHVRKKEFILHALLSKYRINPKKEFFNTSVEYVKLYFDLLDGEWYTSNKSLDTKEKFEYEVKFLNEHVFPSTYTSQPVTLKKITEVFSNWKLENDIKNASFQNVQKLLRETYGSPTSKGYTQFVLK